MFAQMQVDSEPIFGLDCAPVSQQAVPSAGSPADVPSGVPSANHGVAEATSTDAGASIAAARGDSLLSAATAEPQQAEAGQTAQPADVAVADVQEADTDGSHRRALHRDTDTRAASCARDGNRNPKERRSIDVIAGGASTQLTWLQLDAAQGSLTRRRACKLAQAGIGDVCVRNDGRVVGTGGWDGSVRVFHARRAKPLAVLKHHKRAVAAVAFSAETGMLASGGRDGVIALWDVYRDERNEQ